MKTGRPPINEHLKCCGVYGILYRPDMKFRYIGSSINIKTRWCQHRTQTINNDEFHKDLRANPDKYECVVLYEYDSIIKDHHDLYEILVPIECGYIREYKALGHPIVTTEENNLGTRKHTLETKMKLHENHADMSGKNNPMFGKHHSNETRTKMCENHADFNGEKNPRFGTHCSDETKTKISKSNKGKNTGKMRITNGLEERCVTQEDYKNNYDNTIWRRGRKKSA